MKASHSIRTDAGMMRKPGNLEQQLETLLDKEQWQKVADTLQKKAPGWMNTGQGALLRQWLDRLPGDFIAQDPWLLFWSGIVRLPSSPRESKIWFEQSFALFERKYHIIGMFAAWSGVVDAVLYTWSDLSGLKQWIARLEGMSRYYACIPNRAIKARVAASMFAALMYCQPFHRDMDKWTRRAVAASKSNLHPTQRMLINHQLVTYFVWSGEFSKARMIMQHLSREADFDGAAPMAQITHALVEAIYTGMAEADVEACHAATDRGLNLARQSDIHVWDGQLLAQGAWGALMQGEAGRAGMYLDQMNTILNPERRMEYSLYHNQRGWQALLNRDLPMALEHTMEAKRLARATGVIAAYALNHQALCLIHLERGAYDQAQHHLSRARAIGRGRKSGMLRFFRHLLQARVWLLRGHHCQALDELRVAMSMGRQNGYRTTPWWHAASMVQLCIEALQAGIEVEYVQGLIRRRKLVPAEPPLEVKNWPWHVKITTLGGFHLQLNSKAYQPAGKAQQKPLELLKSIIAHGGHQVSLDTLVDALWPDADGDKSHRALSTTLHRLRKMLGQDEAIYLRDGKLGLDERYCWLDLWALEQLLDRLDRMISQGGCNRHQLINTSQQLFGCYQGGLLDHEADIHWLLSSRERLRSRVLRHCLRLGHYWEQCQEWEQAVDVYRQALEVDDLTEAFYQRLMSCYQQLGQPAEALSVYKRCRQVLSAVLNIRPAEATEQLREQIIASAAR